MGYLDDDLSWVESGLGVQSIHHHSDSAGIRVDFEPTEILTVSVTLPGILGASLGYQPGQGVSPIRKMKEAAGSGAPTAAFKWLVIC